VRTRIHGEARNLLDAAGQRVEQLDRFQFIVEQVRPHGQFRILGREDISVSPRTRKVPRPKVHFVAGVLHLDQAGDDVALRDAVLGTQRQIIWWYSFGLPIP
jgi:hypothetical protein